MGEKIKLITYNNLVYIGKHGACALMWWMLCIMVYHVS
jgi:hypothetical protein